MAPAGQMSAAPDEELDDELDDELVVYHQDDPDELDELDDELDELVENHHCALQVDTVNPATNRQTIANVKRFRTDFLSIKNFPLSMLPFMRLSLLQTFCLASDEIVRLPVLRISATVQALHYPHGRIK